MKPERKTRYQTAYFRFATTPFGAVNRNPDAYGNGHSLSNLIRNSAGRCAVEFYGRAVITDHKHGTIVRILKRTGGGITITDPSKERQ